MYDRKNTRKGTVIVEIIYFTDSSVPYSIHVSAHIARIQRYRYQVQASALMRKFIRISFRKWQREGKKREDADPALFPKYDACFMKMQCHVGFPLRDEN